MTDVGHELGSLRHIVDTSLSSKVAMFNTAANKHKESQSLNPFSEAGGRRSPKPTFSKDEYGKPLAGSLTEMRGQKANIHVLKEMVELCQIIDSEGYAVSDEPNMRVIPFGELFNIYNYISDKVVGICLRARKHKIIDFEGEMLFQRRDDNVPVFLLKPIKEIRLLLETKMDEIKRGASPSPQATSVMMDNRSRSASPAPPRNIPQKPAPKANAPAKVNQAVNTPPLKVSVAVNTPPAKVITPTPEPVSVPVPVTKQEATAVVTETTQAQSERKEQPSILVQDEDNVEVKHKSNNSQTEPPKVELVSALSSSTEITTIILEEANSTPTETVPKAEVVEVVAEKSDENNNTELSTPVPPEPTPVEI